MDTGRHTRGWAVGAALAGGMLAVVWRARCAREAVPAFPPEAAKPVAVRVFEAPLPEPTAADEPAAAPVPVDLKVLPPADLCRRLAQQIRAGESPETIALAAELVRRGDEAVPALERTLRSGERSAEIAALRLLVRIGTPRALAAALVRLCQEPASDAQAELRQAFGSADSRPVAEAVADMAAREVRPDERRNLRAVVAVLEGAAIVDALAERIQAAESEEELRPWLDLLAGVTRPSNGPAVERLLLDDGRAAVQEAAAAALAGIGDARACRMLADCGAEFPACREALARVRSPYAEAALREIAASDPDAGVRAAAQQALAGRGPDPLRNGGPRE